MFFVYLFGIGRGVCVNDRLCVLVPPTLPALPRCVRFQPARRVYPWLAHGCAVIEVVRSSGVHDVVDPVPVLSFRECPCPYIEEVISFRDGGARATNEQASRLDRLTSRDHR